LSHKKKKEKKKHFEGLKIENKKYFCELNELNFENGWKLDNKHFKFRYLLKGRGREFEESEHTEMLRKVSGNHFGIFLASRGTGSNHFPKIGSGPNLKDKAIQFLGKWALPVS
jgi:hypothetical protein